LLDFDKSTPYIMIEKFCPNNQTSDGIYIIKILNNNIVKLV